MAELAVAADEEVPAPWEKAEDTLSTRSPVPDSVGSPDEPAAGGLAPHDLYGALLGPARGATATSADAAGAVPILFAWWPRAGAWSHDELAERCTRCLPGVRPGVDLVALPRLWEVEELWAAWAAQHGLAGWQAVWFDPFPSQHGGAEAAPAAPAAPARTPPEVALAEVVAALPEERVASRGLFLYPMYLTSAMAAACERHGFSAVGDADDHQICQLRNAKAWLHPHVNPRMRGPSMRDALPGGAGGSAARGPWGYIASTTEELGEAMRRLQGELPGGARLVLKPSWASGGDGIIVDVTAEQLASFAFPPGGQHTAILEEFVEGAGESPTLYMLGAEPLGPLADQILAENGAVNDGNRWPSSCASERLTQTCVAAAREIQKVWGLRSQWGLDFVVDRRGAPVVVDLNMGRPNGNFSVRLWEGRLCQNLYLHTSSWVPPAGVSAGAFFGALREQGLAWDPAALEGVLVYQHFQGRSSAYVVASAGSWEAVDGCLGRLRELMAGLREPGSGGLAQPRT